MDNPQGGNSVPYVAGMSTSEFAIFKENHVQQLKIGLNRLRTRELIRNGTHSVDGLTIEHKFRDILRFVRLKDRHHRCADVFYGIATMIDHTFNREQRRVLYILLDDIEDQAYAQVVESYKAFDAIRKHKYGTNFGRRNRLRFLEHKKKTRASSRIAASEI